MLSNGQWSGRDGALDMFGVVITKDLEMDRPMAR